MLSHRKTILLLRLLGSSKQMEDDAIAKAVLLSDYFKYEFSHWISSPLAALAANSN